MGIATDRSLVTRQEDSQQEYTDTAVLDNVDFGFAENGLIAYKLGQPLDAASFIAHVGEEEYKKLVNFVLHYIADLDIPIKRCVSYLPL